ncbi:MAG: hypothetical protein KME45_06295 [Stenomitos rutilans HA7619-LM2]|jgi:hypothetical protein|nr:hypothetical protein [Stenomitos rutilans HA7619-LM2]
MITSLSLLERAKQGNAEAIAGLMNNVLQSQDVWVKAALDADCLQIMLKSPDPLHQATCIAFLHRGLLKLQPQAISQVRAYAWRTGDAFPLWIATFPLEPSPESHLNSIATFPPQKTASEALVSNSQAPESSSLSSTSKPVSTQPQSVSLELSPKRRFELFKMGFVLVLATMAYFMVMGV